MLETNASFMKYMQMINFETNFNITIKMYHIIVKTFKFLGEAIHEMLSCCSSVGICVCNVIGQFKNRKLLSF